MAVALSSVAWCESVENLGLLVRRGFYGYGLSTSEYSTSEGYLAA